MAFGDASGDVHVWTDREDAKVCDPKPWPFRSWQGNILVTTMAHFIYNKASREGLHQRTGHAP